MAGRCVPIINEIMAGISDAIYGAFGDNYEIYKEASMQDMEEPAFFISCISPGIVNGLKNRRTMNSMFSVQYFAESDKPKQEINDVYEILYDCLSEIEAGGSKVRGTVECQNISDGVLTATAEYTIPLGIRSENSMMEDYVMEGTVNDGSNS